MSTPDMSDKGVAVGTSVLGITTGVPLLTAGVAMVSTGSIPAGLAIAGGVGVFVIAAPFVMIGVGIIALAAGVGTAGLLIYENLKDG